MSDTLVLTLPNEQRFLALVRLMLSGLASQRDLPYDRLDDLQLAVEAALARGGLADVQVTLRIESAEDAVAVSIRPGGVRGAGGPDGDGGAELDPILSRLVDAVTTVTLDDGEPWLRLEKRISSAGGPA